MKLTYENSIFIAATTYEERFIPKAAGFTWKGEKKQWWTADPNKAAKLLDYADETVKAVVEAHKAKQAESRELSRAADANVDIPVPNGLNYLPYQKAGISYAMSRPSTLIADEMGLGKTIQAIGVMNADPSIRRVLVVCPASLKINWKREIEKWAVRTFTIGIANGGHFPEADIVIVNYDILTKNLDAIKAVTWDLLVADEVHYAKNPKTQRAKALYAIEAWRRVFLTGTPIVNRPRELFPIINSLDKVNFGNFMQYAIRHCAARRERFGWDFSGASHLDELQDKLRSTIMVRRLKKDVLTELPAKRRQVIELPMNGCAGMVKAEQDAVSRHEDRIAELRARVALAYASDDEGDYRDAVEALQAGTREAFTEISKQRHETAVAKIPYVVDHVRDCVESSGKVIVFAHHVDVLNSLLEAFGKEAVGIQGSDNQKARQDAVDRFQNDDSVKVFVGSITAAGVGITLTASSHVIFAELDWVPGNVTQAEDRAHRIGQQNSVLIQHLVLEGSLDATMARTIVRKQEVIDGALNAEYDPDSLDTDNLEAIRAAAEYAAREAERKADREANRETKADAENKPKAKPRRKAREVFTDEQIDALNMALETMVGLCDGAYERDKVGFNKCDAYIGRQLAYGGILTANQAELAKTILRKYHRQLGDGLMTAIYGEGWNQKK